MSDSRSTPARSTPVSTYRLQLGPDLTFADAAEAVPYLVDLGVSHLYLSPVLQARPGSTHGYDVADPSRVSAELGGEQGLRELAETAHAAGLGLVVDLVPNHLGTGFDTPLWRALLAEGAAGPAGRVFDVDFQTEVPGAGGKVVVPVLGEQYGAVLHDGQLQIVEEDGELRLAYFDHRFALSAESVDALQRAGGAAAIAGTRGQAATWSRLHALLEQQHYRLVHWRAGEHLLNYRRFFSIDELAGVRVEDEAVFDLTHETILRLVDDGVVDGLRIDHPDGLRDPAGYLARLAERTGGVWTVVEKITAVGESLPGCWATAGTTGYDFANQAVGLFVDPSSKALLDELDAEMEGGVPFADQAWLAKLEMLESELAPDLRRIVRLLWPVVTAQHLEHRDVGRGDLADALADVLLGLQVYRTYVDPRTGTSSPEDAERIDEAMEESGAVGTPLHDLVRSLLLGEAGDDPATLEVLARFQQLSGAVMAKGVEDTAFYRFRRLLAVNEVGGEPAVLGLTAADFHAAQAQRLERTPTGMVSTATHDTKRGEDTRLRMAALSELRERWADDLRRWHAAHAHLVTETGDGPAPDPQTALLAYQTLVGAWPVREGRAALEPVRERVAAYLQKACREAKERTSWRDPDPDFEAGVSAFLDGLLADATAVTEVGALAAACAEVAVVSGLSQVLLRCTVPGVPDTYQGTETWDLSLVDPDNRRPVDAGGRAAMLADLEGMDPAAMLRERHDGRIKAWVLSRALRTRRDRATCYGEGSTYAPLEVQGRYAEHVVAFARGAGDGGSAVVTIAPRLPGAVMEGEAEPPVGRAWGDTAVAVPAGRYRDVLSGRVLEVDGPLALAQALAVLPVALLVSA